MFDPTDDRHVQLVQLAERSEVVSAGVDVEGGGRFEMKRRRIREALEADGVSGQVDAIVVELLGDET